MFFQKALQDPKPFWMYMVGTLVVFIVSQLGSIPLLLSVFYASYLNGDDFPTNQFDMMTYLDLNLTLSLVILTFIFGIIALYFMVKWIHRQSFLSIITSRDTLDWKRVFFAFGIWTLVSVTSIVIGYFTAPEDYVVQFQWQPFLILVLVSFLLLPFQTSAEELIFRGYLMQGFGVLFRNRALPLVLTSVLFGGLHYFNPEVAKMGSIVMVYYIGMGLFLGYMTVMDEGTELALGVHAANNIWAALLITADWTALQTNSVLRDVSEPSVGFEIFFPILIFIPILLIFHKKYHWKNPVTHLQETF